LSLLQRSPCSVPVSGVRSPTRSLTAPRMTADTPAA
jgi:hypothetical protein